MSQEQLDPGVHDVTARMDNQVAAIARAFNAHFVEHAPNAQADLAHRLRAAAAVSNRHFLSAQIAAALTQPDMTQYRIRALRAFVLHLEDEAALADWRHRQHEEIKSGWLNYGITAAISCAILTALGAVNWRPTSGSAGVAGDVILLCISGVAACVVFALAVERGRVHDRAEQAFAEAEGYRTLVNKLEAVLGHHTREG